MQKAWLCPCPERLSSGAPEGHRGQWTWPELVPMQWLSPTAHRGLGGIVLTVWDTGTGRDREWRSVGQGKAKLNARKAPKSLAICTLGSHPPGTPREAGLGVWPGCWASLGMARGSPVIRARTHWGSIRFQAQGPTQEPYLSGPPWVFRDPSRTGSGPGFSCAAERRLAGAHCRMQRVLGSRVLLGKKGAQRWV